MEQHPIPQQISSYEFKLVGDMTLKQFLKAAAGIVIAVIIYSSKLIFFLKYPLMVVFGAGGLMIAFVPFQDRPMETWIISFLRSIYSPTIYTYKKMPDKDWLNLMNSKAKDKSVVEEQAGEEVKPIKDHDRVKEFIESLPSVKLSNEQETFEEKDVIGKIGMSSNVNKLPKPETERNEEMAAGVVKEKDWREEKADLNLQTTKLGATAQATFGAIPMPDKPDIPNLLVGMVTDISGKIVEGAIVEIQDQNGNPSRVLKTNSLGQFKTANPLANGKYLIITEKENYNFDRVNVDLTGVIVDPIKIKAIV